VFSNQKGEKQSRTAQNKLLLIQKGRYIDTAISRLCFLQPNHYSKGIQVVLSTSKLNQLDTKGLPPAQGRNPSHNDRFCHQEAGSSLMKIGKGPVATRKLDLLWWKLAKKGSETLQVTSAFPKWIISDKRLPASSRSGSSRISDCQPLLGAPVSCPSLFLLLRIKVSTRRPRGKSLISFIKSKDWRAQFTAIQTGNKLAVNQRKMQARYAKSNSLGEAIHIRSSCIFKDWFQLSKR